MPGEEWTPPGLVLAQEMPTNVMFTGAPMTPMGYGTNITKGILSWILLRYYGKFC